VSRSASGERALGGRFECGGAAFERKVPRLGEEALAREEGEEEAAEAVVHVQADALLEREGRERLDVVDDACNRPWWILTAASTPEEEREGGGEEKERREEEEERRRGAEGRVVFLAVREGQGRGEEKQRGRRLESRGAPCAKEGADE